MNRKNFLYLAFAQVVIAFNLISCVKENPAPDKEESKMSEMTFTATTEGNPPTKTYTDANESNLDIRWQSGDCIRVFSGGQPTTLTLASGEGTTNGTFSGLASASGPYYALSPSQTETALVNNTIKDVNLPRKQTAVTNSFDPRCGIMCAVSSTNNLSFKHVCAYFQIETSFPCQQITIKSNNNADTLVGKFDVGFSAEGIPVTQQITKDTAVVSLVPQPGQTVIQPGKYLIAVLPSTLRKGFMISFTDENNNVYIRSTTSRVVLSRGEIKNLGAFSKASTPWSVVVEPVQLWDGGPKWSTINLGATSVGGYGDFFAWGEIEPYYSSFGEGSYSLFRDGKTNGYVSGNYALSDQVIWNGTTLLLEYDAAAQLWGGGWRMPTESELSNLLSNTSVSSVAGGWYFGGMGHSIFLPFSGAFQGSSSHILTSSIFWSSTKVVDGFGSIKAGCLRLTSSEYIVETKPRYHGNAIRPVCQ